MNERKGAPFAVDADMSRARPCLMPGLTSVPVWGTTAPWDDSPAPTRGDGNFYDVSASFFTPPHLSPFPAFSLDIPLEQ